VSGQLHVSAALPPGKVPRYPLDRKLSGPHNRSGRCREEKILDPSGTRTPTYRSFSPYLVAILTALSSSSPIFRRTYCLNLQDNGISQEIDQNKKFRRCRHAASYLLVTCLVSSAALNMDIVRSSETFARFYPTTRRNIPEGSALHSQQLWETQNRTMNGEKQEKRMGEA
jgi:hypothetical protein